MSATAQETNIFPCFGVLALPVDPLLPLLHDTTKPTLTLLCPGRHKCSLSPKFQFYFKKGSSKKISYERREYESVDEKSLS